MAIDGGTIVLGADGDDDAGPALAGAVYVFEKTGDIWTEAQKVTASDPAHWAEFGLTVAVHDDVLVVGAFHVDAAYIFRRTGSGWNEDQKLVASYLGGTFGRAVATNGRAVVVGAPQDDDRGPQAGAVYVFVEAREENLPPVADAGADVAAECESPEGAAVTLDGTDSTDPDGSIVRFEWFEDLGLPTERFLGEGDTISSPGPIFAGITRRSSRSTRV